MPSLVRTMNKNHILSFCKLKKLKIIQKNQIKLFHFIQRWQHIWQDIFDAEIFAAYTKDFFSTLSRPHHSNNTMSKNNYIKISILKIKLDDFITKFSHLLPKICLTLFHLSICLFCIENQAERYCQWSEISVCISGRIRLSYMFN